MAVKDVALVPIELNGTTYGDNGAVAVTFETGTVADGFAVDYTKADNKIVVLFQTETAGTAPVTAGDMINGTVDITLTVPAGVSAAVLDSDYFKKRTGKVVIKPSATAIKCAAVVLP